jgi:hypothetical protein
MRLSELSVFEGTELVLSWWGEAPERPKRMCGGNRCPVVYDLVRPDSCRAAGISYTTARRVLRRNQIVGEREANFLRE